MVSETAQTVDNALLALALAAEEGPRTIREVGEHLGLGTTTARRVVVTLHQEGMLRRREDGRYDIGPRLIRMTEHLLGRFASTAEPLMTDLARQTGRSVLLSAFRADSVFVLHQVDPEPHALHVEYRTGFSRALTEGSDGLVILAHLNRPRRAHLAKESGLVGLAGRLSTIEAAGHLVQPNDAWGGLTGLSAPVIADYVGIVGALTLLGKDLDDRLPEFLTDVTDTAASIGRDVSERTRGPHGTEADRG